MDFENEIDNLPIGIITYHRAVNYGAVLQAYALEKKITSLNRNVLIVDYLNNLIEKNYRIRNFTEVKGIKEFAKYVLLYRHSNTRYRKFEDFRKKHLHLTKIYADKEQLEREENKFSKFIVGSDQVWNPELNLNDETYLLDFNTSKRKKNAYAASFGSDVLPSQYKKKFSKMLSDFNQITVRENQAIEIINDLMGKDVEVVLDPVFLLTKQEWYSITPNLYSDKKFIFVYAFVGSKNVKDMAFKLAEEHNCEIYWLTYGREISSKIKYIKDAGPLEFLALVKNAEFVLTNSFHGTVFSIVFNKQFYLEYLSDMHKTNSRLENIVNIFDLNENVLTTNKIKESFSMINYNKINEKLEHEKAKSINKLKLIIEAE